MFYAHLFLFFFNDTATTEIYTLSLHDALPIYRHRGRLRSWCSIAGCEPLGDARLFRDDCVWNRADRAWKVARTERSEEHTSELQSRRDLVCRLLLEKKKKISRTTS